MIVDENLLLISSYLYSLLLVMMAIRFASLLFISSVFSWNCWDSCGHGCVAFLLAFHSSQDQPRVKMLVKGAFNFFKVDQGFQKKKNQERREGNGSIRY